MGKISDTIFKDWQNGDIVHEVDYERERGIIKAAVNDNFDRINKKAEKTDVYTKVETDDIYSQTKFIEVFNPSVAYKRNNVVSLNGNSYMAKQDTTGHVPTGEIDDIYWGLASKKGEDGVGSVKINTKVFIAEEGQNVFVLPFTYETGENKSKVTVAGAPQGPDSYEETNSNTITLSEGVIAGTKVIVQGFKTEYDDRMEQFDLAKAELDEYIPQASIAADNAIYAKEQGDYALEQGNEAKETKFVEAFNVATTYKRNNTVSFNGASYMAKQETTGNTPVGDANDIYWGLLARKGNDGTGTVTTHTEKFIATEGQKVFPLQYTYDQFQNRTSVIIGPVPQDTPDNYEETTNQSITLSEGVPAGTEVVIKYFSESIPLQSDIQTVVDNQTIVLSDHAVKLNNHDDQLAAHTSDLAQKLTKGIGAVEPSDLSQTTKEQMTGGSVAVVGSEMVNYINLIPSAVKREILDEEIFTDKTLVTYGANYTAPFVDSTKNYFPSSVLVTLKSSQLINTVTIKAKVRNIENVTKVQARSESLSTVFSGAEITVNGAVEINETITVNKTSDRNRVYFFVQGSATTAKYEIIDIDISVNDSKSEILTISDLAVSFGTGTITKTSKTYEGVAKKSYIDSKVANIGSGSWSDKKWMIFGDSISDDDFFATKSHYYDKIKADTGILTYPYAVGGSGYATNTTNPPAVAKWGATNNVLTQIDNQGQSNPDYISIEAGTNDWGFTSCVLGSVADILVDNSTFYSLVAQAVRKVKNKYPYTKMFVMTLLPRSDLSEYRTKLNANNNTMEQFNQAIRDVCAYYSVPVLDMYRLSQLHSDELQPNWWYDSLHPSEMYQTTVFSDLVYNFMKSI